MTKGDKMEKQFNDIKEGDKLYQLSYWFGGLERKSKRELRSVTVKYRRGNYLKLKNGICWTISRNEFGISWFLSKKEVYEKSLRRHKIKLEESKDEVNIFQKEIDYLTKRIKQL